MRLALVLLAAIALGGVISVPIDNRRGTRESRTELPNKLKAGNVPFGVATGGWLHLEEWFFSVGGVFDFVASPEEWKQGRVFPPVDQFEVTAWQSEGELVADLVKYLGPNEAIKAFVGHRNTYVNATDFALMKSFGITHLRVNVGWWAFDSYPVPMTEQIIADPAYPDKKFVTLSIGFLEKLLTEAIANGITILFDVHAMPGGSSNGSYNGVFPAKPVFWESADLMSKGQQVVANMLHWYNDLSPELKKGVHGFTLMNEPSHLLKQYESTMVSWLTTATDTYRKMVAVNGGDVPLLYVNLIGTAFADGSTDHLASVFAGMFSSEERAAWAVLDVHNYLAWDGGHDGCDAGCKYTCDAGRGAVDAIVTEAVSGFVAGMAAAREAHDIPRLACSEWSLATFDQSARACRTTAALDSMYYTQTTLMAQANVTSFFWTWNMPYGGWHEAAWSLKHYLTSPATPVEEL